MGLEKQGTLQMIIDCASDIVDHPISLSKKVFPSYTLLWPESLTEEAYNEARDSLLEIFTSQAY